MKHLQTRFLALVLTVAIGLGATLGQLPLAEAANPTGALGQLQVDPGASVSPLGRQVTESNGGAVDAANSTTTLLGNGGVYTGSWVDATPYGAITVQAYADQASAANGLSIQQSQDGTNADTADTFSVSATTNFSTTVQLQGAWYRVVYTNGATGQATFRLKTVRRSVQSEPRTLTANGNKKVAVQEALPAGANNVGSVNLTANAAGGSTLFKARNLAATVTAVKASAGTLYSLQVVNTSAATAFVQCFNAATGSVTLGTTTPDLELQVATAAEQTLALGSAGISFGTAISCASATAEGGGTGSAAGVQLFVQYQ